MTDRASYRSSLGYAVLNFGSVAVLALATSVVSARLYGIDVIGQFALAAAPYLFLTLVSTFREQAALVRELSLLPRRDPRITGLFTAVLGFSTATTLLFAIPVTIATHLLLAGPVDSPEVFGPALVLTAGYVALSNPSWNLDMIFAAFRGAADLYRIRVLQAVVLLVLTAAMALWIDSVWGLVLASLGSWIASLLYRVATVRAYMRLRVPRATLRSGFAALPAMIRWGIKTAPGPVFRGIGVQLGIWLLGAYASVAAVGAYNRAAMLSIRLSEVNQRIIEMLFPTLLERRAGGDRGGFDQALYDSIRYTVLGLLLPAAVAGGAATQVMAIFGPGFGAASDALVLLLLLPPLSGLALMQESALWAVDRPGRPSLIAAAGLVVTVAVSVPLTISDGVIGPAAGLVCGYLTEAILSARSLLPYLSAPLTRLWPARQMIGLAVSYGAGFWTARGCVEALDNGAGLALAALLATPVFLVTYRVIGGLEERDRARIRLLAGRLRAGLRRGSSPGEDPSPRPTAPDR